MFLGLGLGGQQEYFGLWIDKSFSLGHSKAHPKCSTYNSPKLSQNEEFGLHKVEGKSLYYFHPTLFKIHELFLVWCLREKEVDEDSADGNGKSILDNAEAMAMLEMTSHKLYSKDVREPDLDKE